MRKLLNYLLGEDVVTEQNEIAHATIGMICVYVVMFVCLFAIAIFG